MGSLRRDSVGSERSCSFFGSSLGVLMCFRRAVSAFSSYFISIRFVYVLYLSFVQVCHGCREILFVGEELKETI